MSLLIPLLLLAAPARAQAPIGIFDQGAPLGGLLEGARRADVPSFQSAPVPGQSPTPPDPPPASGVSYRSLVISDPRMVAPLFQALGPEGFMAVLKLNRIDAAHIRKGTALVIPDPVPEVAALSPFPRELPPAARVPKFIVVSLRVQAFAAFEFGRQVRWGPVSTGARKTPTTPGLYYTNWRARKRASTINPDWILEWSFNIDNATGRSMHEYSLPGHPASHGCIRTLEDDAQWIYHWAEEWELSKDGRRILKPGTPVLVFGDYDFKAPPPWKRLVEDPQAAAVTLEDLQKAMAWAGLLSAS